jgi:hypothetical protein
MFLIILTARASQDVKFGWPFAIGKSITKKMDSDVILGYVFIV